MIYLIKYLFKFELLRVKMNLEIFSNLCSCIAMYVSLRSRITREATRCLIIYCVAGVPKESGSYYGSSFLNASYGLTIANSEEVIWKYHDAHSEVQDRAFEKIWKVELQ